MTRMPVVLICDDDSTFHLSVKYTLKGKFECRSAYNSDEALVVLRTSSVDAVLLDVQMRTPNEGLDSLPRIRELDRDVAIIMSSARTDFETVRAAMKLGANDYIPKDFEPEHLLHTLSSVLERKTLALRLEQKNFEASVMQGKHPLLGSSRVMQELRRTIEKFRSSPANVLITGETGTGKEAVARNLRSTLHDGTLVPFVTIDSSTILSTTAESILFGHEKGAFTGAERMNKGIFEEADGGIVYFDEIGNMPLDIQSKLLRVVQEKEVVRLGSSRPIQLDFRVFSATNKDLDALSRSGQFKPDLLQRLNVLPIHVPPLRERTEDIPELLAFYGRGKRYSEDALDALRRYRWPGNVRELVNLVAYVGAMAEGDEIDVADLPPAIRDSGRGEARKEGSFYDQVADFEKALLAREYAGNSSNISQLALKLGMDRSHLYSKLREYGIHAPKR